MSKVMCLVTGAFLAASLLQLGCNQKVDTGGDKMTEGRQSVVVYYKNSKQTVYFDDLKTRYPVDDETPAVRIDDVVLGSGMLTKLDKVYLNFVGNDGYTPIGVCGPDQAPTPGKYAKNGYIKRGTGLMYWDPDIKFEKCMFVKETIAVEVADDADDLPLKDYEDNSDGGRIRKPSLEGVPFKSVQIHYKGKVETVDVKGLPTATLLGEKVVLIKTLIEATSFDVECRKVTIDFEGSDGYRPTLKGMCTKNLPMDGKVAGQAGINLETSELLWDQSLDVEKCAMVKLVADMYLEPAS